ncbi:MAG: purL [Bacteriovoracaceae bacterium]|nr:purL [Bacteriovoracaceae bacterium]
MSQAISKEGLDPIRELAAAVGLSDKEWNHLIFVLGRHPSESELQMIGVMWSEHCSYKSSKRYLKKLITKGKYVLEGPGENAGLIALDAERGIAFKIESHNHPSFVEPFQGAATGVGGILRDIFTMGARPIALGDYLRFGDLNLEKHQYLLDGVIGGIAHYGNCMGIPVVAGHVGSGSSYNGNILVNVFALGIVDRNKIFRSNTGKPGQVVMVWGAKTGRDGIHGASLLASADFESGKTETKEQKIRVQVGDPFKEKVLMEATLECMQSLSSDLAAIQDMGAAGLTSSTTEMAAKSKIGMKIDLSKVPVRETGMKAFELLLSESQERMLAIVEKGSEEKFKAILNKWGCEGEVVGETDDSELLRMTFDGQTVVDLPIQKLMDAPPADLPEPEWPAVQSQAYKIPDEIKKEWEVLEKLLCHPSVASKKEIFKRYDTTVGAATVFGPGQEASVLWVGSKEHPHLGIAFKGVADENFYQLNPRFGAKAAMAKAVRSLSCVGARARAFTDGINVGNPKNAKTQAALSETVEGLNEAIIAFETPCVSGNVSMYNQTVSDGVPRDIYPTTFVVVVGVMDDVRKAVPSLFQSEGSEIWLLEIPGNRELFPEASLYAREFFPELKPSVCPFLDLEGEQRLQNALLKANDLNLMLSCRDVSTGGLAVSLAKACFSEKRFGFEGDLSKTQSRRDQLLFGEAQGRVILEINPNRRSELMKLGAEFNLQIRKLGNVTQDPTFRIRPTLSGSIETLFQAWSSVFK